MNTSELSAGDDFIDGEVIEEDQALELGEAHRAIVAGAQSTSSKADYDQSVDRRSTATLVRQARVNQEYNEVETGGITGIGSDDAAPLQDVDFELG